MEEGRRGGLTKFRRIQWTRSLEKELIWIAEEAEPEKRGYYKRLEELWESYHAALPSRGTSLAQRYLIVKKRQRSQDLDSEDEEPMIAMQTQWWRTDAAQSQSEETPMVEGDGETVRIKRAVTRVMRETMKEDGNFSGRERNVAKWATGQNL